MADSLIGWILIAAGTLTWLYAERNRRRYFCECKQRIEGEVSDE